MARLPDVLPQRPSFYADKYSSTDRFRDYNYVVPKWSIKSSRHKFQYGIPSMLRWQASSGDGLRPGEARVPVAGVYYMQATYRFGGYSCSGLFAVRLALDVNRRQNPHSAYNVVSRDGRCDFKVCQHTWVPRSRSLNLGPTS